MSYIPVSIFCQVIHLLFSHHCFSLLLGIAEQSQALSAALDANTEEKRLLSRLLIKTKKAQAKVSDLQRYLLNIF